MNQECGCCEGIEVATPEQVANRPGLSAISFRVGTHATFLESMMARLPLVETSSGAERPLARLTTRQPGDPSIALLDAWATVADVLTFYQERIANEGYLRTATERRSVVELARLVGYAPRPGVAASAYLAFSMEDGHDGEIPAGTRAQSVPKPGETPQVFETSEAIEARAAWNTMRPRLTKVQELPLLPHGIDLRVQLAGIGLNLKRGDVFLIRFKGGETAYSAVDVTEDTPARRTSVKLVKLPDEVPGSEPAPEGDEGGAGSKALDLETFDPRKPRSIADLIEALVEKPGPGNLPPRHAAERTASLAASFTADSDASFAALAALRPELSPLVRTLRALQPETMPEVQIYVMRVSAAAFGHNAPAPVRQTIEDGEPKTITVGHTLTPACDERENVVYLDTTYPGIVPPGYVVVVNPHRKEKPVVITRVKAVATKPRTAYGISARTTRVELFDAWWSPPEECKLSEPPVEKPEFAPLRDVMVYAQSEELHLAEVPSHEAVGGNVVEMDRVYDGLTPGRWLLVVGEREDIPGFVDGELVMLSSVRQLLREPAKVVAQKAALYRAPGPGGLHGLALAHESPPESEPLAEGKPAPFTELTFENELLHEYKRGTVVIHGNVAHATQGETRHEILGSGDASIPLQSFELKQRPLTHVSSPTPAGATSTLAVRVGGVLWQETQALSSLGPTDRAFITQTDDDGKTRIIGGTGENGARFHTGVENVTAVYRTGIGASGNVAASQISLLMTRPQGLRGVTNPLPARGGADRESRDLARENTPLAVMALDRLISVVDYVHFARTFAGVGKAAAERTTEGGYPAVRVVIAGTTETPLDATSDVHRNLLAAYHRYGAPSEPVVIEPHRPVLLFMSVKIRVYPEYEWIKTEPKIRAALLDAFGFERRKLGEDALLSEVIAAIHRFREVDHVDVDAFGGIRGPGASATQDVESAGIGETLSPAGITAQVVGQTAAGPSPTVGVDRVDEIAYFTPAIPETLVLMELTP